MTSSAGAAEVWRNGDGAAVVRQRESAQALRRIGHRAHRAIVARGVDAGGAAIVGQEVDGTRIVAPLHVGHVAIERAGQHLGAAAIGIGHIELGGDVALRGGFARNPGDAAAIGRGHRRFIGTRMACDLAALTTGDAHGVDFSALERVCGVGRRGGGVQNRLAVRHPRRFAMQIEIAERKARARVPPVAGITKRCTRAAGRRSSGRMAAGAQAAGSGSARRAVKASDLPSGDHATLQRRIVEVGDLLIGSGIQPAYPDLTLSFPVGKVSDAPAVGRPGGRGVLPGPFGQPPRRSARGRHAPQIRADAIGIAQIPAFHVDYRRAVGIDPGASISRQFHQSAGANGWPACTQKAMKNRRPESSIQENSERISVSHIVRPQF